MSIMSSVQAASRAPHLLAVASPAVDLDQFAREALWLAQERDLELTLAVQAVPLGWARLLGHTTADDLAPLAARWNITLIYWQKSEDIDHIIAEWVVRKPQAVILGQRKSWALRPGLPGAAGDVAPVESNAAALANEDVTHQRERPRLQACASLKQRLFAQGALDAILYEIVSVVFVTRQHAGEPDQIRQQQLKVVLKSAHVDLPIHHTRFGLCEYSFGFRRVKMRCGFAPPRIKKVSPHFMRRQRDACANGDRRRTRFALIY